MARQRCGDKNGTVDRKKRRFVFPILVKTSAVVWHLKPRYLKKKKCHVRKYVI